MNLPNVILSDPEFLKNKVLKGLDVVLGVFALLLSFFNIYLQNYPLAAVEVIMSMTCWFVYRKTQDHSISSTQAMLVPYFFVMIVLYGTYTTPLSNGLLLWSFTFPIIFYLLFGKQHGFYASLIIGGLQVINILNKDQIELYATTNISINFLLAYVSVWVVSHVYEMNRENVQDALRNLALKDSLTGANNRLSLKHIFEKKVKAAEDFSIVMLDIDLFKNVNDKHGHEAGDLVLVELTKTLIEVLSHEQVFRLGGDELALLIPKSKKAALSIMERVRETVEKQLIKYKEEIINLSFSAGISQWSPEKDLPVMLKEADECLYKAKSNGRNQIL
ncbi:GGDEF domain-containing protein [Hydrogenovibrio sp. 3SP14C1]|uniref:GGDEF domain-containing protein n=1 Tax=Hydrogenovibrio sp. 3SP14C1 TaxID=3038774 RepID=UPI002416AC0B|nr:GGDEF domain-containing protein [Hydrogenovibrio sp. 3SP14C1]MDG4812881.1 GGDEF domain-containing protein [Hydrogenovibrio sp. 3SP14C1]